MDSEFGRSPNESNLSFAFNDSNFSDRNLRIEIMAGRSDSKSYEGCGSLADWARNRKRRREDLKKETGLHLFKKQRLESSARSCSLFTCTSKGNASFRIVEAPKSPADSLLATSFKSWSVCGSGNIPCCKVDASEKYSLFGGKGVEVCIWVLENTSKYWAAKSPPKNSLGIFTATWFTLATFLSKDDHRKIVTGTSNRKVCLYDISAQRRPALSVDFRETPIKAIAEDIDGH